MKKRFQVFISSTYRDLAEERATVLETLLKSDCIPAGMELFAASDDSQWKVIQKIIDESDYYVVIIAGKYGSEYKNKSYTQLEYEYALKKNKKIIALLHREPEALPLSKCEKSENKQKKLAEFRILTQKKLCDFWSNKDELGACLFHSITKLKNQHPQDGWIKASKWNLKKLSEKRNKNLIKENIKLKQKLEKLPDKQQIPSRKPTREVANSDLRSVVSDKIEEIDRSINSLFPEKIYSPKHPDNKPFSTQLLINSLSSMGIPLRVSLEVVESSIPEIVALKRQVSQLETSHIRKAVASSMYKLDQDIYNEDQIQSWGDSYVRRYGNPNIRPLVLIDRNKSENPDIVPLTYKFVRKQLVPELLKEIVGGESFSHLLKSCRKKEDSRIADIIIKAVKNLDINRIHYSTLLSLSKDLALQPPHPWLVSRAFDFDSILYDYERSYTHAVNVMKVLEYSEFDSGKYPLRECVHHSCSGILSIYGVFMGCGYLSPLYNLTYQVYQIIEGRAQDVLEYSKIGNLRHDLFTFDKEIKVFHKELLELRDGVDWKNPLNNLDIHNMFLQSLHLFTIFHRIFTHYYPDRIPRLGNEIERLLTI